MRGWLLPALAVSVAAAAVVFAVTLGQLLADEAADRRRRIDHDVYGC